MTVGVLLFALLVTLLASSVHLTMPVFPLMVVRLIAAEHAAYLVLLELIVTATALMVLRDAARIAVVGIALAGLLLAAVPLGQLPVAISAMDGALDGVGAPPAISPPFSLMRFLLRPAPSEVRQTRDIAFRSVGGVALRLDRYDGAGRGPHPALVVVHGGSWRNGDKGEGSTDATVTNRIFAARGITVYDVQYRLAPASTFPAQLEDLLCALGHVRSMSGADDVDPQRVALLGRSAGAHLALLAAYRADRDPVPAGCSPPATVRGVVSLYGPTDLVADYRVPADPDLIGGSEVIATFLGGTPDTVPDRYARATPQQALDRPVPPTLLIHGQADQIVQAFNSRSLADALVKAGTRVALVEIPWAGHSFDAVWWGPGGQLAEAAILRFLSLVLGLSRQGG